MAEFHPFSQTEPLPANPGDAVDPGAWPPVLMAQKAMLEEGIRRLAAAQKQLAEERRDWEQDAERQAEEIAARMRQVLEQSAEVARAREALASAEVISGPRAAQTGPARLADVDEASPLHPLRLQLEAYRDELYDRYKKRRDHLMALQESVRHAAAKVQEEKRLIGLEAERTSHDREALMAEQTTHAAEASALQTERAALLDQHRLIEDWQKEVEREYDTRLGQVESEEARQAGERHRLEVLHAQYQHDLVRLDRGLAELREREESCAARGAQLDEQTIRFKELAANLQDQARTLEEVAAKNQTEESALATLRQDLTRRAEDAVLRAGDLEGQQAALIALRTKIERWQAEVLQREQRLTEQRLRQDKDEKELREGTLRVQQQQAELQQERERWLHENQQVQVRRAAAEALAAEREQRLTQQSMLVQEQVQASEQRRRELQGQGQAFEGMSARRQQELHQGEAALAMQEAELQRQLAQWRNDAEIMAAERGALLLERQELEARRQAAVADRERLQTERDNLERRLPALLIQSQSALEQLSKARTQLRDCLRETHEYAHQCAAEVRTAQRDLLGQSDRLQEQQHQLAGNQDEHRVAVISFRQTLGEWQERVSEFVLEHAPGGHHGGVEPTLPAILPMHNRFRSGDELRILDRVRVTAQESVYRVLDVRQGEEALLRQLSYHVASERQAEFRTRFREALTVRHENLAATLDVLEMDGSPAVLQELIVGAPAGEWLAAAAGPSAWLRLVRQAAAGLAAVHAAHLVHGHLHAGRILLTEEGTLKICGLGEPVWLLTESGHGQEMNDAPQDLLALGQVVRSWLSAPRTDGTGRTHEALQVVRERLQSQDPLQRYPSVQALLEHLDRLQQDMRANGSEWQRLLELIRLRLQPAEAA